MLISSNGRFVACTQDASKLGEKASDLLDGNELANEVVGGAGESSAASAELTKLAEQQRRLINHFKV